MSQFISVPDDLYKSLSEQASKGRMPVETLIAHLLERALSHSPDNLPEQITQAYAAGQTPPLVGNWHQLEAELAATISPFDSLEAAMNHARGRP